MKEKLQYVLGIETSTLQFRIALTEGKAPISAYSAGAGRNLDGLLLPAAGKLLEDAGLEPKDISAVAVSTGPGYFTGIRIGIVAAKGIAYSLDRPAAGVPSLDSVCWNANPVFDCLICAVIEAGRGEIYTRLYRYDSGRKTREAVTPCLLERPERTLERIKEKTIFLCRDARLTRLIKETLGDNAIIMPPELGVPSAVNTARLGFEKISREPEGFQSLRPVYLRKPDAEVNFGAGPLTIERASEKDLPEITRIERQSFPSPWSEEMFRRELDKESGLFVTARRGSMLCGYAAGWTGGDEFHLANLAVAPEFRGGGTGKKLLKYVLDSVKSLNVRYVILEVRQGNMPAFNLYKKLGFKTIGKRDRYYADTGENAVIMALLLENKKTRGG